LKNLVFYGDGLLCPPEGYGEQIIELLVMRRPAAGFKSFHPGEETLTLETALRGAPSLIGKAPDFVYIGLGSADMLRGVEPAAAIENLRALIQLLMLKTQARVALAKVCAAFLPPEARVSAAAFNAGLDDLATDRVGIVNLDNPVSGFLEAHRRGGGGKHSLHLTPLRLTSMGRVFLSNTASRLLALEDFFPV
jgi:hypothetical protein